VYNNKVNSLTDFEYERRFFCEELPSQFIDDAPPNLIIQNYYLAKDGYAIRVRVQSSQVKVAMTSQTNAHELLDNYAELFDLAFITIKGPQIGGTRYEVEHQIDALVARELVKRGNIAIVKNSYSLWFSPDGWFVDVFGAQNTGLVIAECERLSPVVNLEIPRFCLCEITDDRRFSNDGLVNAPYSSFQDEFLAQLTHLLEKNPDAAFSGQFGENKFASN
jgi:CYTH domain-containing protein